MRKGVYSVIFLLIISGLLYGQETKREINGSWTGSIQGLRVVFHITKNDSATFVTMDSPDQGVKGIKVDLFSLKPDDVIFTVTVADGNYIGKLNNETGVIEGIWYQRGMEFPLNLVETDRDTPFRRPQEPVPPYPYISEDVTFKNVKDGITLAGTLTYPDSEGPFPAVLLVSGSGPQDRNEEILGHKPFLVIADYLTKQGFAVLRYDDRGYGESSGDFINATTKDFADDAVAAIEWFMNNNIIDNQKISVMGHSEGAMVAAVVAAENPDIHSIVMLAGSGLSGEQTLMLQNEKLLREARESEEFIRKARETNLKIYEIVQSETSNDKAAGQIRKVYDKFLNSMTEQERRERGLNEYVAEAQIKELLKPWMRYFLSFDIKPYLRKITCPVLVLNGGKDFQIPYEDHVPPIEKALKEAGNNDVETRIFPGLNHLFQTSETGSPAEYASIQETFSPEVLKVIAEWLQKNMGDDE